jgi:hypothetical protein
MPGEIQAAGFMAKLAEVVFSYFTDEDGYKEMAKRSALRKKKAECAKALADNRFVDLKRLTDELHALAEKP